VESAFIQFQGSSLTPLPVVMGLRTDWYLLFLNDAGGDSRCGIDRTLRSGKCEGPDVASAGLHLNPYTKKHGKDNPQGRSR
jgi:hypothetical protein